MQAADAPTLKPMKSVRLHRAWPGALSLALVLTACGDRATAPDEQFATCGTVRNLVRGQLQLVSGASALDCMVVGSSRDTSEFVFITANASAVQDELRLYQVRGDAATVARGNTRIPAPSAGAPLVSDDSVEASLWAAVHSESQRRHMTARLTAAASGPTGSGLRSLQARSSLAAEGDTLSLRVGDALASNMCTTFSSVRAVVRAVSARAIIAQDVTAPAGGFAPADFAALAKEYDELVHPTMVRWFGEPSDINSDGKVVLLFTPAINRLTPPGSLGFVGGYFWSADLLPRNLPAQNYSCPASNEQEIMYFLTPDPSGQVNGNRFTVPSVFKSVRGTIAHELQHLINFGRRQRANTGAETDWLNEGLSHLAEELVGRAARRYADTRALTYDDVLADLDDFDSFFRQNLIRFRSWMSRPDLTSAVSRRAVSELAPRGAAWALLRFSLDQYGGADPSAFTRALVGGPQVDVANLEARARTGFDEILSGFLTAVGVNAGTTGLATRYQFLSWNMRSAMSGVNAGVYPLRVSALPGVLSTQSYAGSGNFFSVTVPPAAAPFTLRVQSVDGTPATFAGARAIIVRTR